MSRRAPQVIPAASVLLACVVATSAGACAREDEDRAVPDRPVASVAGVPAGARVPATAAESATVRSAGAALGAWLDGARESADRTVIPALPTCEDGGAYFPSPLLAHHELLAFELRGDTVIGRARVTSVAEQDLDRRAVGRFVARARVRTDELEWDLVPTDDGWAVCNGIRFGYRGADSLTRWMPEGSSYDVVRARADSIHRARGAPTPDQPQ